MKKPVFSLMLTPAQFNAAAAQLAKLGLGPDSGTLPETSGVVLSYVSKAGVTGTLVTFTVEKKPMFAPVGVIQGRLKGLLGIA
ncbi:MAG TPA: hypothetical protein VHX37_13445 [Acidobacteriaceae bacterium]|jgi:hypothetical protein|nr:hypothetical protein [Acidobacteriaceae bacterium]